MRLLSGLGLLRRGNYAVVPPLGGRCATRRFSGRVVPPPKNKIISILTNNWDLSLGVFFTLTVNFFYLMDFDGRWAQRAVEDKQHSKMLEKELQEVKKWRAELKDDLERERAKMAGN